MEFHVVCGESVTMDADRKVAWRTDAGRRVEGRALVFSNLPLQDGETFTITVEDTKYPWMSLGVVLEDPEVLETLPSRARMLSNSIVLHPRGHYKDGRESCTKVPETRHPMTSQPGDTWSVTRMDATLQFFHNDDVITWQADVTDEETREARLVTMDTVYKVTQEVWVVVDLGLGTRVRLTGSARPETSEKPASQSESGSDSDEFYPKSENVRDMSQLET